MTDVMLVTKDNYPSIFKAFEIISHDCGRQAGHTNYAVPLTYEKDLPIVEASLKVLIETADSDFEALCIGEELERKAIVEGYQLGITDNLLQKFFEEFN